MDDSAFGKEFFNESNSWTVKPGNEAWLYSDASAYYRAFVNACSRAQKTIYIAGWDFHSDTVLTYRKRRGLRPKKLLLGRFLLHLARQNPHLNIFVLTWDYAPFYLLERQRWQSFTRAWLRHPRIHFHMDDAHPISASQHQKFVVVDGNIAFAGGLDLTIRRWDENDHIDEAPFRRDPDGVPYGAFHDYQLGVTGPIVGDFIELFANRWKLATGQPVPKLPDPGEMISNPLPIDTAAIFLNANIAFSRTMPAFREARELTEIAKLYQSLVRYAKKSIIIENQYLTAHTIVSELCIRLREEQGPEVIIILPEKAGGWLEVKTMGVLQDLAIKRLRDNDTFDRLRIYYPHDKGRAQTKQAMTVHSKIILVDDAFFSIGSANLNNRSMGYDTECQLTIDATDDSFNQAAIREFRAYLFSHHCILDVQDLRKILQKSRRIIPILDAHCTSPDCDRYLAAFPIQDQGKLELEDMNWLDMEKPTELEQAVDQWGFASELAAKKLGVSPRILVLGLTIILALVLGLVWHHFLKDPRGPEGALRAILLEPLADPKRAVVLMPLIYAAGALLFIPINLLIIVTASIFSTAWAFLHIFIGIVTNVALGYGLGLTAGRFIFERFFGKRTKSILERIGKGQFLTILFIRVFPIAPSSLINLAAGSGRIPFFRFLAATLLGMAPGTIMLVLFQKSLMDIFREPGFGPILTLLFLGIVTYFIFRWSKRRFSQYRGRS